MMYTAVLLFLFSVFFWMTPGSSHAETASSPVFTVLLHSNYPEAAELLSLQIIDALNATEVEIEVNENEVNRHYIDLTADRVHEFTLNGQEFHFVTARKRPHYASLLAGRIKPDAAIFAVPTWQDWVPHFNEIYSINLDFGLSSSVHHLVTKEDETIESVFEFLVAKNAHSRDEAWDVFSPVLAPTSPLLRTEESLTQHYTKLFQGMFRLEQSQRFDEQRDYLEVNTHSVQSWSIDSQEGSKVFATILAGRIKGNDLVSISPENESAEVRIVARTNSEFKCDLPDEYWTRRSIQRLLHGLHSDNARYSASKDDLVCIFFPKVSASAIAVGKRVLRRPPIYNLTDFGALVYLFNEEEGGRKNPYYLNLG